jgi:glutathione S-transferase
MAAITVHHLERSRSHRILWLLEELELPYEVVTYARHPVTKLAPPSLKAVHPLGKSPVVTYDGVTLAESGAIIEYLVGELGGGKLAPDPGTPERARFTFWLHYAEGSAGPPMLLKLVFDLLPRRTPAIARPLVGAISSKVKRDYVLPQMKLHLDFIESELGERPHFAGESFSAADIQMSFPLEAARARGGLDDGYPKILGFLERMRARPAYQRAAERGGPHDLADL